MPRARTKPTNYTVDDRAFTQAINNYVNGRITIENPTIRDYVMHYGNNSAVAQRLVQAGVYTNYNSAMRQVQRLMKKPDTKVTKKTSEALGTLRISDKSVTISIKGYASYDGGDSGWKHMNFTHTVTPSQMRQIISATQGGGNQTGLNKFMDVYGVPVYFSFLTDNLSIQIIES